MITLSEAALAGLSDAPLGVAVSGGGDSLALLYLLAARGYALAAVTLDHGLRPESAAEAEMVAQVCKSLNVPHDTLRWTWDGSGNLQAAARVARQQRIADWAVARGIGYVALGHTLDDQAETVLMRLLRGSGVDGLSGMAQTRADGRVTWIRPLLQIRRAALRDYLRDLGVTWADDPSNDNPRYERVRIRQAIETLGLDMDGLAETADRMRVARAVLERDTRDLARACVQITPAGEVVLDLAAFDAPEELRLRLLSAILRWISGAPYRPRLTNLRALLDGLGETRGQTLQGCVIRSSSGKVYVRREVSKTPGPEPVATGRWDHRWRVEGGADAVTASHIAALGEEGLRQCENWRRTGHPREALLTTPALWQNGELRAAPLAGMANGWRCTPEFGEKGPLMAVMTR